MSGANPARGEAALTIGGVAYVFRPSFAALVAAEQELGSLFALVERIGAGDIRIGEIASLFWHCRRGGVALTREQMGEALAEAGLARAMPVLKALVTQILQGR